MSKSPAKPRQNPYKILYWMGAALLLLALGITVLVRMTPKKSGEPVDPERTLLWLYDGAAPTSESTAAILIEESSSRKQLVVVPFSPSKELRTTFGGTAPRKTQDQLAASLGRRVHHRVFMPYSVVETLIDGTSGIRLDGKKLDGKAAVAYVRAGNNEIAARAGTVMLALAAAVDENGLSMGASEGLKLARQVETDHDLLALGDVLGRWNAYSNPRIQAPASSDPAALQPLLLPDAKEAR